MVELSVDEVVSCLRARPEGSASGLGEFFPSVSIDSRTIQSGQCFLAIQGDRYDGHDFIEQALARGAGVIIHSRPLHSDHRGGCLFLQVDETEAALQKLGNLSRTRWGRRLLAISGSMGKTTTREFTATLLEEHYRVFRSPRNLNNQIGVPLALLELTSEHEVAVLELGMNHAGEIRRLAQICRPDAGLLTNIGAVHMEFFSDLEAIAAAKGELLEELPKHGTFFFNADDPRLAALAETHSGEVISFGLGPEAVVRVCNHRLVASEGTEFELETPDWRLVCTVPFVGKHFLYNIAAATAVACCFGLSRQEIEEGIRRLEVPAMRGQLRGMKIGGKTPVTVWDDSYNSNPEAVNLVLETVEQLPGYRHKVFALGDMLELGAASCRLHRQCGARVAQCRPHLLVTVGRQSQRINEGAAAAGFPADRMVHFQTAEEAVEFLASRLGGGDLLLVKGSRGVRMDRLIQGLEEQVAT